MFAFYAPVNSDPVVHERVSLWCFVACAGGLTVTNQQCHPLARIQSELPDSPRVDSGLTKDSSGPLISHQSKSSDLEAYPCVSDGSLSSVAKKKKGFLGKISKSLRSFTEGFKRKSSTVVSRSWLVANITYPTLLCNT